MDDKQSDRIGRRLCEVGGGDNVIMDPPAIRLTGHLLDHFAEQRETVIGVFERDAGRERLWR